MGKVTFIEPKSYSSMHDILETQIAIKRIKDYFQRSLSEQLNLTRVSAPLFVTTDTGLNDYLNGVERPVSFDVKSMKGKRVEIVQSLAKWKRMALHKYGFDSYEGLYTDMNAIRRDEDLDNIHSIYVDQWDWEKIILEKDRNVEFLKGTVKRIYKAFKDTEAYLNSIYSGYETILPEEITFITAQELEDMYPDKTPKERENAIAKDKVAVFIIGIGGKLNSGEKHDGRSPDYDDWLLNGDILFWYPVLDMALELSSMGIRVDKNTLLKQLKLSGCEDRLSLEYHQMLLEDKLPLTIGGGIGQSRICMFFLKKAHIGEIQASIWPQEMINVCEAHKIALL
ncbi:MAG: aspartate--ammonia ligase [Lutispora sp.]|nr:aspartate--ammonia ligase [Lutispora sp.]MDD4835146.1 aspartate--ammonia ligase [Lutispora sp.]